MPIYLNSNSSTYRWHSETGAFLDNPSAIAPERLNRSLTIGLVNNMSDGALVATERQFLSLLDAASNGISIHLSLYSLPGIVRNEFGMRHVGKYYSNIESLWDTCLDGIIITGREPMTPNLVDEPYWQSFTRVIDWARENTTSTICSCLAAHAAVLHMDGISRIKNSKKLFGVFKSVRQADHPLLAGFTSYFGTPHSRWNGISEEALMKGTYKVLTQSVGAGVDTFIKKEKSLFIFFQGHPEYTLDTLLLEYRRDVARYYRGEADTYPNVPKDYFDPATVNALDALKMESIACSHLDLLSRLSLVLDKAKMFDTWNYAATGIYKNWMEYLCAQKTMRLPDSKIGVESHGFLPSTPLMATSAELSHSPDYVIQRA